MVSIVLCWCLHILRSSYFAQSLQTSFGKESLHQSAWPEVLAGPADGAYYWVLRPAIWTWYLCLAIERLFLQCSGRSMKKVILSKAGECQTLTLLFFFPSWENSLVQGIFLSIVLCCVGEGRTWVKWNCYYPFNASFLISVLHQGAI